MRVVNWPRINKFPNDFQWSSMIFIGSSKIVSSMNLNDVPLSSICFHWFANYFHLLFIAYYINTISMFFIDIQWCSQVFHSFPIPFKILMVSIVFPMVFNDFHWLFNDFAYFYNDSQWLSLISNDSHMFLFVFPIRDVNLLSEVFRTIFPSPRVLPHV